MSIDLLPRREGSLSLATNGYRELWGRLRCVSSFARQQSPVSAVQAACDANLRVLGTRPLIRRPQIRRPTNSLAVKGTSPHTRALPPSRQGEPLAKNDGTAQPDFARSLPQKQSTWESSIAFFNLHHRQHLGRASNQLSHCPSICTTSLLALLSYLEYPGGDISFTRLEILVRNDKLTPPESTPSPMPSDGRVLSLTSVDMTTIDGIYYPPLVSLNTAKKSSSRFSSSRITPGLT